MSVRARLIIVFVLLILMALSRVNVVPIWNFVCMQLPCMFIHESIESLFYGSDETCHAINRSSSQTNDQP